MCKFIELPVESTGMGGGITLLGFSLFAFGPAAVVFYKVIAPHSHLVIVTVTR